MFALDDLARVFDLTLREDVAAGGLTVTPGLADDRAQRGPAARLRRWPADLAARLHRSATAARGSSRSISSPARSRSPRSASRFSGSRAPDYRGRRPDASDRRAASSRSDALVRLTLDVAPATPHAIAQEGTRLVIRFEADALDTTLPSPTVPDLISSIRPGDSPASLVVDLGPRFALFRTADSSRAIAERHASSRRRSANRRSRRSRPPFRRRRPRPRPNSPLSSISRRLEACGRS